MQRIDVLGVIWKRQGGHPKPLNPWGIYANSMCRGLRSEVADIWLARSSKARPSRSGQDFNLYPKGKEKPLKAFKQSGDSCFPFRKDHRHFVIGGGRVGEDKGGAWGTGGQQWHWGQVVVWRLEGWWACHLGPGDHIAGQRRDGSRMSGLWMMVPSAVSEKTRRGVGREGALGLGADELEILRHPGGDVEGQLDICLEFRSCFRAGDAKLELSMFRWHLKLLAY